MADRTALGLIGTLLAGATAVVMLIGATVVNASLSDPSKVAPGYYEVSLSAKAR